MRSSVARAPPLNGLTLARMRNCLRNLALFVVVATVVIAAAVFAWSWSDPYRREMRPVYAVIKAGEQNWGSEATAMLRKIMARTSDRHALADHLLSESDGSLVAEGMVLAVQGGHPRARAILQKHLTDKRWNWAMANNDDLAKQLIAYLDKQETEQWVLSWLGETENAG